MTHQFIKAANKGGWNPGFSKLTFQDEKLSSKENVKLKGLCKAPILWHNMAQLDE